jgi:hypothetical protein
MAKEQKLQKEEIHNYSFTLPTDAVHAILVILATVMASNQTKERNLVLNMTALVCCSFHSVLAPLGCACIPALTRWVNLYSFDDDNIVHQAQSWWRWMRCRKVNDTGLASIAASATCGELTRVDLGGCSKITDGGLASLAAGCSAITYLNLTCCYEITDRGLKSLADGCGAITDLNLTCCYDITDTGLKSLVAGCGAITRLNLSHCSLITDTGLANLAGCALTHLDIFRCPLITNQGLEGLNKGVSVSG